MTLDQRLLVCESMLARLDAAMRSAEAEAVRASAFEDELRRLLGNLESEQARLEREVRASPDRDMEARRADDEPLDLRARAARIATVEGRLLLLRDRADEADAQHP
jgi:hypothetical protein